jgi:hypothetical protein
MLPQSLFEKEGWREIFGCDCVATTAHPPQSSFSKEEVPDDERARNDLADFQQTPSVAFDEMVKPIYP